MAARPKALSCEDFVKHLAGNRLRLTSQRAAIVEAVFHTNTHFTAEQLLTWARERDESVSRATIYRTLPLLVECGLVRELDFGSNQKLYDPNYSSHPDHNHIVCQDCGKIFEFESPRIEQIARQITDEMGFLLCSKQLRVTAHCETLKRTGSCQHKNG